MSEKPEDATNTAAAAEPAPAAQPPPVTQAQPAREPATSTGFLHSRALQLAAVGLLGLLLGCLFGGCVVAAVASHHGGGFNRYDEDRRHDRYRDGDPWDWDRHPPQYPYPQPPIAPAPNPSAPNQPTPILPTPRVS